MPAVHRFSAWFAVVLLFAGWHSSAAFARNAAANSKPQDACALLTLTQVSTALEVTGVSAQHPSPSITTSCIWSDDTNLSFDHRRVTLSIVPATAFELARSMPKAKTAPAPPIGDDAYYQLSGSDSPSIMVRKRSIAITIRVLNGLKFRPFTIDEEKTKEATLARAALAAL